MIMIKLKTKIVFLTHVLFCIVVYGCASQDRIILEEINENSKRIQSIEQEINKLRSMDYELLKKIQDHSDASRLAVEKNAESLREAINRLRGNLTSLTVELKAREDDAKAYHQLMINTLQSLGIEIEKVDDTFAIYTKWKYRTPVFGFDNRVRFHLFLEGTKYSIIQFFEKKEWQSDLIMDLKNLFGAGIREEETRWLPIKIDKIEGLPDKQRIMEQYSKNLELYFKRKNKG